MRLVRYQAAGGTGIVGLALPWASAGLTLAGNGLLGFAAVCAVRTRTGEPGAAAGTAVVPVLLAPSLMPQVARWVPAPSSDGTSDHVRWIVLAMCTAVIAISVGGRSAPRWMSRFCDPAVDHQMTQSAALTADDRPVRTRWSG